MLFFSLFQSHPLIVILFTGMPRARPLSQIGEEASLQSSDSVDELSAFSRHNTPGFISVGRKYLSSLLHEHSADN